MTIMNKMYNATTSGIGRTVATIATIATIATATPALLEAKDKNSCVEQEIGFYQAKHGHEAVPGQVLEDIAYICEAVKKPVNMVQTPNGEYCASRDDVENNCFQYFHQKNLEKPKWSTEPSSTMQSCRMMAVNTSVQGSKLSSAAGETVKLFKQLYHQASMRSTEAERRKYLNVLTQMADNIKVGDHEGALWKGVSLVANTYYDATQRLSCEGIQTTIKLIGIHAQGVDYVIEDTLADNPQLGYLTSVRENLAATDKNSQHWLDRLHSARPECDVPASLPKRVELLPKIPEAKRKKGSKK